MAEKQTKILHVSIKGKNWFGGNNNQHYSWGDFRKGLIYEPRSLIDFEPRSKYDTKEHNIKIYEAFFEGDALYSTVSLRTEMNPSELAIALRNEHGIRSRYSFIKSQSRFFEFDISEEKMNGFLEELLTLPLKYLRESNVSPKEKILLTNT